MNGSRSLRSTRRRRRGAPGSPRPRSPAGAVVTERTGAVDGGRGIGFGNAGEDEDVVDGDGRHGPPPTSLALATIPRQGRQASVAASAATPGLGSARADDVRAVGDREGVDAEHACGRGRRRGATRTPAPRSSGQPAARGVGVPRAPAELGEVGPVAAPQRRAPLAEVELDERVVDPSGLPVEDAGEPVGRLGVDEQLALVQVAVHEHRVELARARASASAAARASPGIELELVDEQRCGRRGVDRRGRVGTSAGSTSCQPAARRPSSANRSPSRSTGMSSTSWSRRTPGQPIEHHDGVGGDGRGPPSTSRTTGARTGSAERLDRLAGRRPRGAAARPGCGRGGTARRGRAVSRTSFDQPVKSASIGRPRPEPEQLAEAGQAGRRDHGQGGVSLAEQRHRRRAVRTPVALWQ